VRFAFKYNSKKDIYFMPLQDERAQKLLPKELVVKELSSVIYYRQGIIFTQSTAALTVGKDLNLFLKIVSNILLIIPKVIRDKVYNFIAKHRYRWFEKFDTCPIPPPALQKQFL
jgi:predicted DCC family thiol-disulfide oxidoreductase YuxK